MSLIRDVYSFGMLEVINESRSTGTMRVRGICQRAGAFNNNKRKYGKSILEREVQKIMPKINERRLLGELDHPTHDTVKLANASHLMTGLKWDGNVLIGEAELLNTPTGKIAQQLVKDGVKLGWSSRGLGSLTECADKPGFKEVNEDFNLLTWDLVGDPSTDGAYPGLCESTQYRNVYEETKRQVVGEKIFIKLLEQKLRGK